MRELHASFQILSEIYQSAGTLIITAERKPLIYFMRNTDEHIE